jgi:repressor LexA
MRPIERAFYFLSTISNVDGARTMLKISDKQEEMLAFIEGFVRQNGYPPTHEEIRTGLDISTKSLVNYHLGALESAELLTRVPNTPRGIRLARKNGAPKAPSGNLYKKQQKLTRLTDSEILELTYGIVTNDSRLYALKIEGETDSDGFASNGDIVLLQSQNYAENGDLVAVCLHRDGQTRFKRYYRENGHVRLQSANEATEMMIITPDALDIQGKIVAVIRQVE